MASSPSSSSSSSPRRSEAASPNPKSNRWYDSKAITRSAAPLQVLCAGQWRCATSSLQLALAERLQPPFAPCIHGSTVFTDQGLYSLVLDAMRRPPGPGRRALLHRIFDGFEASADFPGMAFADDLLDMYPGCRVVLNRRATAAEWRRSVAGTLAFYRTAAYRAVGLWWRQSRRHHALYREYERLACARFGWRVGEVDMFGERFYERHNEWVREQCRRRGRRWLEWTPEDGWSGGEVFGGAETAGGDTAAGAAGGEGGSTGGGLCGFVGRPVPRGGEGAPAPFPRTNETAEIHELTRHLVRRGLAAWAGFVVAVVVAAAAVMAAAAMM